MRNDHRSEGCKGAVFDACAVIDPTNVAVRALAGHKCEVGLKVRKRASRKRPSAKLGEKQRLPPPRRPGRRIREVFTHLLPPPGQLRETPVPVREFVRRVPAGRQARFTGWPPDESTHLDPSRPNLGQPSPRPSRSRPLSSSLPPGTTHRKSSLSARVRSQQRGGRSPSAANISAARAPAPRPFSTSTATSFLQSLPKLWPRTTLNTHGWW